MKEIYFIFNSRGEVLLRRIDGGYSIPQGGEPPLPFPPFVLRPCTLGDCQVVAFAAQDDGLPSADYEYCAVRQSYYKLTQELYDMAGKCSELLFWHSSNRYCGVCGHQMEPSGEISRRCPHCGREIWPSPSPAVIVLIHRGEKALLARGRNFRRNFYGLIAGFVETGESLEEALRREVREETGLEIKNIRYFGSQPWPYPLGIMVGFEADYASGELHLQEEEIAKAAWFTRENLPEIPEKLSIARRLIDNWVRRGGDLCR